MSIIPYGQALSADPVIPNLLISSTRAIVERECSILTLAFTHAAGAHWRRALTEGHGLPVSHPAVPRHGRSRRTGALIPRVAKAPEILEKAVDNYYG